MRVQLSSSFPQLLEIQQALTITLSQQQKGTRVSSSFPYLLKYSRPLPSPYHSQQEGTRGVSSSYPHLLEVQQTLIITLLPTTRGYKRSILFLSLLAGSTAGHYHHPITHNKRVQEEYPLPFPTCWKYSRPLPSPYHPQQEGTRGVSSSFPHLLVVQEALTITLSSTTRGFLSLLAGSTAGHYHHPITHNKRVQEYPLSFPTCWWYRRPLPSPYHPQQEGTRGVSSFFPHLLEVQLALPITLSPTIR